MLTMPHGKSAALCPRRYIFTGKMNEWGAKPLTAERSRSLRELPAELVRREGFPVPDMQDWPMPGIDESSGVGLSIRVPAVCWCLPHGLYKHTLVHTNRPLPLVWTKQYICTCVHCLGGAFSFPIKGRLCLEEKKITVNSTAASWKKNLQLFIQ